MEDQLEIEPVPTPGSETQTRNKVQLLPTHIKAELLKLIAQGLGSQMCHKRIHDRFSNDPDFIPFSRRTLQTFMTSNKGLTHTSQVRNSSSPAETGQVDPSNYRGLVLNQFQAFTNLLESMQSSADRSDPKFNDELIRVQKEWRSLWGLVHNLQEPEGEHDADALLKKKLNINEYYSTICAEKAYQDTNGNEKIELFKSNYINHRKLQDVNFRRNSDIKEAR